MIPQKVQVVTGKELHDNNNIGADKVSQILTEHTRFVHSLDRF